RREDTVSLVVPGFRCAQPGLRAETTTVAEACFLSPCVRAAALRVAWHGESETKEGEKEEGIGSPSPCDSFTLLLLPVSRVSLRSTRTTPSCRLASHPFSSRTAASAISGSCTSTRLAASASG